MDEINYRILLFHVMIIIVLFPFSFQNSIFYSNDLKSIVKNSERNAGRLDPQYPFEERETETDDDEVHDNFAPMCIDTESFFTFSHSHDHNHFSQSITIGKTVSGVPIYVTEKSLLL